MSDEVELELATIIPLKVIEIGILTSPHLCICSCHKVEIFRSSNHPTRPYHLYICIYLFRPTTPPTYLSVRSF